ncbi:MAG: TonB-dependent receptor [Gammaproteobacteria bacterium]|nr:TonB-dependent receptor [Gammaproteobacteria bacterium]
MIIKTLVLTLLLSAPLHLFAIETDTAAVSIITEDDFLSDIPIVLSASRLSQPQTESATSVTIINRQMIEASTATSIPELMRMVPGFQVGFYDGNIPVVTYHGMSDIYSRRIQVLIDGRSVYIPTWGGVPWKSLPITLDEIEQIEVTRGPNAAAYGSNSFLAVISIKTFNAFDTQAGLLKLANGNNKQHQALYRVGAQTENSEFRVTIAHRGDEGMDDFADAYDEELLKFRIDYTIDNNSQFFYQSGINKNQQYEQGGDISLTHRFETSVSYHHFKWERNLDDKSSVSVQLYRNQYSLNNSSLSTEINLTSADLGYPAGITFDPFRITLDSSSEASRQDLEVNYFYKPSKSLRTVSGFSTRRDSVKSEALFDTSETFTTDVSRAFGHAEWTMTPQLIINTGIMIEDHQISDTSYSPRIALIHKFTNNQSLRYSYSTANRAPSTAEESINITYRPSLTVSGTGICVLVTTLTCENGTDNIVAVPNLNSIGGLDFEEIESNEIGFYGDYFSNKLTINAKIFHDMISDIIVDISPNEDGGFENSQMLIAKGIEFGSTFRPDHDLYLNLSYANISITDKTQGAYSTVEVFSNSAPKESYGLSILKQFKSDYSLSLEYFQIGEMRWTDIGSLTEPYDILNLKLSKKTRIAGSKLTYSLLLKNLSGEYNDYNEYGNVSANNNSSMSERIRLEVELQGF